MRAVLLLPCLAALACGSVSAPILDAPPPDTDAAIDRDAGIDAPVDAPTDAAVDAPIDAPPAMRTITVIVGGNGTGTVTSSPAGIACPGQCSLVVADGASVTLAAAPSGGSTFAGWGGACTGTGACVITATADTTVNASFGQNFTLIVTRSGAGGGSVASSPAGIACGTDCDQVYAAGTVVTLTATPDATSVFAGWTGGGCRGTGTCVVTVDGAVAVDAAFAPGPRTLTTRLAGTGGGSIASTPAGITCGADCTEVYAGGTVVMLTATADAMSTFTGWSGACVGTAACVVTMDADRSVTATFDRRPVTLTVTRAGTGAGAVTSSPSGIDCGATCSALFAFNTSVTLTAAPSVGSTFTGWGGACAGTATTCTVAMTAALSATATFTLNRHPLRVTPTGNGTGTVTSSPAGISCGATCTASFDFGTVVTLTATPTAGHSFGGWSGACTGTGTCVVTVNAATSVLAQFDPPPNIVFVTSTTHTGNLGGLAGADRICAARATAAGLSGTYRAWLSTDTTSALSRLGSASGWVRTDGRPVANTPAELLAGEMYFPIRLDENARDVGEAQVLTGTGINGMLPSTTSDCTDYSAADTTQVTHGNADAVGSTFTVTGSTTCAVARRLYCFGVTNQATVAVTPPRSFRRAFITAASWTPGGGLTDADALCTREATAASLPGTYRALLATSLASPASRFSTAAGTAPWARVDGVLLADTPAALFSSTAWHSGMNVQASGAYMASGNTGVWGGSTALNVAGSTALTCGGSWTTTASTGGGGRNGYSTLARLFANDAGVACTSTISKLVCLQQ